MCKAPETRQQLPHPCRAGDSDSGADNLTFDVVLSTVHIFILILSLRIFNGYIIKPIDRRKEYLLISHGRNISSVLKTFRPNSPPEYEIKNLDKKLIFLIRVIMGSDRSKYNPVSFDYITLLVLFKIHFTCYSKYD